jgi:AcrR family transcriptional regulator
VRIDGRTARAERTRAAIVDAHLALLAAGDLKPTGERIAEAAGVSLRTLWTNFKDMETLFAAVGHRLREIQIAQHRVIPEDLPLARRVELFCEQRARMLEILAPAARAAATREPFSAALRHNRTVEIGHTRDEIASLFKAELASRRPELMDALLVNTTFAGWSLLRDQLGLSVDAARAVMESAVRALLAHAR